MPGTDTPTRRKSLLRQLADSRILLLMCVPAIVFFIVFNYMPMPGAWIAFTNFNYRDGIFGSPSWASRTSSSCSSPASSGS